MTAACVEKLAQTLPEMKALFQGHFDELALDKGEAPLDPQYEVYLERERRGEVMLVVVRERGLLVGYLVAFIAPGLHYRTVLTCTTDIFYIVPEHRTGGCGKLLFAAAEKEARRRGVKRWFVGTKMHADCGAMLERFGFKEIERHYSKMLEA